MHKVGCLIVLEVDYNFFRQEQSHKSYRPLTVLSYRLTWAICKGLNTKVFHLENVFYHLLVCLMFFK